MGASSTGRGAGWLSPPEFPRFLLRWGQPTEEQCWEFASRVLYDWAHSPSMPSGDVTPDVRCAVAAYRDVDPADDIAMSRVRARIEPLVARGLALRERQPPDGSWPWVLHMLEAVGSSAADLEFGDGRHRLVCSACGRVFCPKRKVTAQRCELCEKRPAPEPPHLPDLLRNRQAIKISIVNQEGTARRSLTLGFCAECGELMISRRPRMTCGKSCARRRERRVAGRTGGEGR